MGRALWLLLLGGLTGLAFFFWSSRPIHHPPGVLVATTPLQQDEPARLLTDRDGFKLTAVARYSLRGRILGKKRYWSGVQAKIVPVDVALGWGAMSDQKNLDGLKLSMANRFFFYRWQHAPPIPAREIAAHCSNNHLIPANAAVGAAVRRLRLGEIAEFRGWLVDVAGPGGFGWRTSRQRADTGNGACEVFYVEEIKSVPPVGAATSPGLAHAN
jgi:hypothetical protein